MKKFLKFISIPIFVLTLLTACGGDDESVDLVKPTATIALDRANNIYMPMSSIVIDGSFSDDTELAECQVNITGISGLKGFELDWEPETYKIPLAGTEVTLSGQQIFTAIPVDIRYGDYQLSFKVIDAAGNYSIYTQDIVIQ